MPKSACTSFQRAQEQGRGRPKFLAWGVSSPHAYTASSHVAADSRRLQHTPPPPADPKLGLGQALAANPPDPHPPRCPPRPPHPRATHPPHRPPPRPPHPRAPRHPHRAPSPPHRPPPHTPHPRAPRPPHRPPHHPRLEEG